jgi:hypothetical protein
MDPRYFDVPGADRGVALQPRSARLCRRRTLGVRRLAPRRSTSAERRQPRGGLGSPTEASQRPRRPCRRRGRGCRAAPPALYLRPQASGLQPAVLPCRPSPRICVSSRVRCRRLRPSRSLDLCPSVQISGSPRRGLWPRFCETNPMRHTTGYAKWIRPARGAGSADIQPAVLPCRPSPRICVSSRVRCRRLRPSRSLDLCSSVQISGSPRRGPWPGFRETNPIRQNTLQAKRIRPACGAGSADIQPAVLPCRPSPRICVSSRVRCRRLRPSRSLDLCSSVQISGSPRRGSWPGFCETNRIRQKPLPHSAIWNAPPSCRRAAPPYLQSPVYSLQSAVLQNEPNPGARSLPCGCETNRIRQKARPRKAIRRPLQATLRRVPAPPFSGLLPAAVLFDK